jgi:exodeoxyribonuclease-5
MELEMKPAYTLNSDQETAMNFLLSFCRGESPERMATLAGFAGTGKTFLSNRLVERIKEMLPGMTFGMTAPTHKAVRVLKKHSEIADQLEFGTIHSFLGLKQKLVPNPKNKNEMIITYEPDFSSGRERRIEGINILFVDETSMLHNELFDHILTELRSNSKLRVIFMGDPLQIPPVKKKGEEDVTDSIPFIPSRRIAHKIAYVELNEPQRQAKESPIIMYATSIREHIDMKFIPYTISPDQHHALEQYHTGAHNKERLWNLFREYFCTEEFQADPDYVKIIAWRNNTVDYFNREIRLMINKATTLPKLIEGEKLIMDAPLVKKDTVIIANNEDVVVRDIKVGVMMLKYTLINRQVFDEKSDQEDPLSDLTKHVKEAAINVYHCKLVNDLGIAFPVAILHEDSEQEYAAIKEKIKKAALNASDMFDRKEMWKQFYKLEDNFAWVKYNYCLTAHKAQGSTYDYCISMEWDIDQNWDIKERNRIRYVAATRARHKLFIVK